MKQSPDFMIVKSYISLWHLCKNSNGEDRYYIITNQESKRQLPEARGCIPADDMGLGKIFTKFSDIISQIYEAQLFVNSIVPAPQHTVPIPCAKSTLINVPLSAISNLERANFRTLGSLVN